MLGTRGCTPGRASLPMVISVIWQADLTWLEEGDVLLPRLVVAIGANGYWELDSATGNEYVKFMTLVANTVDEVGQLLRKWAAVEEPVAGDVPAVLVAHGTVCAELLAAWHSEDIELQVAGLLHDVGLLLYPGDELGHPTHGANYVRKLLGQRTARLIELHVDAQRYLELTMAGYEVMPPPTATFAPQPKPMSLAAARAFEQDPLFEPALELRRADDAASDVTVRVGAVTLQRELQRARTLALRSSGSASPGSVVS